MTPQGPENKDDITYYNSKFRTRTQGEIQHSSRAPAGLLSREQWHQQGRTIKKGVEHRAVLELEDQDAASGSHEYTSDKLYGVEDTVLVKKRKTDPWVEAYWSYFVADHNQRGYIRWSDRDKEWKTITPAAPTNKWTAPYLRKGDAQAHLAEREIRGVFGGEFTRWIAIDADCHKPIPELQALFLDQLNVLVKAFSQRAVQVADEDAKGAHVFLFYPRGSLEQHRHQVAGTFFTSTGNIRIWPNVPGNWTRRRTTARESSS